MFIPSAFNLKGPDGDSRREPQTDLGSEGSFKDTGGKGRRLPLR